MAIPFAYKTLFYNFGTFVSALDNDVMLYVELQCPQIKLHFGVPSRMVRPDWTVEYKAKFPAEYLEPIWDICERARIGNNNLSFLDFKCLFEEPGEKTLYLECKKSENDNDHRNTQNADLELTFQHQIHAILDEDACAPTRRKEPVLQASAEALLDLGQGNSKLAESETANERSLEAVVNMSTPNVSGSTNEELMNYSHAIVGMSDMRPTAADTPESGSRGTKRRRLAVAEEPKQLLGRKKICPKCSSEDTKFKYFNNKNTSQPRYQCLQCRIFFTFGGKLAPFRLELLTGSTKEPTSAALEDILNSRHVEQKGRKRRATEPLHLEGVQKVCHKCESTNAVFKYLNNGCVDQPRYQCLSCGDFFQFPAKRLRQTTEGDTIINDAAISSNTARETNSFESASTSQGHRSMGILDMSIIKVSSEDANRERKKGERKRPATEPAHVAGIPKPCAACGQLNTKFKYLNNRSVNQPRYQCLDCQHFFTYHPKLDTLGSDLGTNSSNRDMLNKEETNIITRSADSGHGPKSIEESIFCGGEKKVEDSLCPFATDLQGLDTHRADNGSSHLGADEKVHGGISPSQSRGSKGTKSTHFATYQGCSEATVQSLDRSKLTQA